MASNSIQGDLVLASTPGELGVHIPLFRFWDRVWVVVLPGLELLCRPSWSGTFLDPVSASQDLWVYEDMFLYWTSLPTMQWASENTLLCTSAGHISRSQLVEQTSYKGSDSCLLVWSGHSQIQCFSGLGMGCSGRTLVWVPQATSLTP